MNYSKKKTQKTIILHQNSFAFKMQLREIANQQKLAFFYDILKNENALFWKMQGESNFSIQHLCIVSNGIR